MAVWVVGVRACLSLRARCSPNRRTDVGAAPLFNMEGFGAINGAVVDASQVLDGPGGLWVEHGFAQRGLNNAALGSSRQGRRPRVAELRKVRRRVMTTSKLTKAQKT
jgi:hypothetical protein